MNTFARHVPTFSPLEFAESGQLPERVNEAFCDARGELAGVLKWLVQQ